MQLIKRLALGAMAASTFIISGCQPTQIKPVESGFNATTVTYTYNLGDQNISNKEIFDAVIKEFLPKLSVVRQFTIDPPTRYRDGTTSGISKASGVEIKSSCVTDNNCKIEAEYINGDKHLEYSSLYYASQKIVMPIEISRQNNIAYVKVLLDGKAITREGKNAIFIPYDLLLTSNDIYNLYQNIASLQPTITINKKFNGEFNIDSDDTIVYANFKRLMGLYDLSTEDGKNRIGKNSAFQLKTPTGLIPLFVEVYPTRQGSIMSYQFTLPYQVKPDGSDAFDANLTDGIIRTIKNTASL